MADRQPVDHLAEIDTLLRAELSVEPSHEFLPRVRERIRTEPTPSRWRSLWIIAPLAAAAVVVLAVALSLRPGDAPPAVDLAASRTLPSEPQVPGPKPPAPSRRASRVPNLEPRVPNTDYRTPSTEPRTPNAGVLIDPRQREALAALVRLANQGALTGESFKLTTQPPAVIAEQVKAIVVDPVAVSPIAPRGVLPSELERK